MKDINARIALISLSLALAVITQAKAEDYYFYEGRNGELGYLEQEAASRKQNHKTSSWCT